MRSAPASTTKLYAPAHLVTSDHHTSNVTFNEMRSFQGQNALETMTAPTTRHASISNVATHVLTKTRAASTLTAMFNCIDLFAFVAKDIQEMACLDVTKSDVDRTLIVRRASLALTAIALTPVRRYSVDEMRFAVRTTATMRPVVVWTAIWAIHWSVANDLSALQITIVLTTWRAVTRSVKTHVTVHQMHNVVLTTMLPAVCVLQVSLAMATDA